MRKKLTALFLTFCLALTPFASAFAAGGETDQETVVEVVSSDDLTKALQKGGSIKLTDSFTVSNRQNWTITKDVVLDLNGYTIESTFGSSNYYLMTIQGASLTIKDSSKDQSGKIEATDPSGYGIQLRGNNSSFTLLGGTIETHEETLDIYTITTGCSIQIKGGSLISTADSVLNVRGEDTKVNITGGDLFSDGRCGIYVSNYGDTDSIEFNMSGGTLNHTGGNSGAIQMYKGATVTIGGDAVITSSNQVVQVQENCALKVTGGTLSSTNNGNGYLAISADDDSVVTISDGNILTDSSSSPAVKAEENSYIKITGGTFKTEDDTSVTKMDDATIVLAGGNFPEGTIPNEFLSSGATVVNNEDGTISIEPSNTAAYIVDDVPFSDLAEAIAALEDGSVMEIMPGEHDVTVTRTGDKQTYGSIFVIQKDNVTVRPADAEQGATLYGFTNEYNDGFDTHGISGQATVYVAGENVTLEGLTILPLGGYTGGDDKDFPTKTVGVKEGADGFTMTGCTTAPNEKKKDDQGDHTMMQSAGLIHVSADGAKLENNSFGEGTTVAAGWADSTGTTFHEVNASANYWGDGVTAEEIAEKLDGPVKVESYYSDADMQDLVQIGDYLVTNSEQLQDAINAAEDGDVIICAPGTYDKNISFNNKSVTVKAQYPAYTAENGRETEEKLSKFTGTFNTSEGTGNADFQENQTVVIEGFAFSGDGLKVGNTNYNTVGNLEVRNCTMEFGENLEKKAVENYNQYNYFVKVSGNSGEPYASVTVEENYISGKPVQDPFGITPIQLWDVKKAVVQNNNIALENADKSQAISISMLDSKAEVTVTGNEISGAGAGGIYVTTWKLGGNTTNAEEQFEGTITVEDNILSNVLGDEASEIFIGYEEAASAENAYGLLGGTIVTASNTDKEDFPIEAVIVPGPAEEEEPILYTVSFVEEEGETPYGSVSVEVQEDGTATVKLLEAPEKEGYEFLGWQMEGEEGILDPDTVVGVHITGDTVFVAQWEKVTSDTPDDGDEDPTPDDKPGTDDRPSRPSHSSGGSTGGIGTRLPEADEGGTPSVTGFESDTNADLTVDGRYQFRITSLDGHTPVLTVNNSNFTVTLASQNGRDYFYVITCAGTPGSTAAVSVDGKYLLTATVGGSTSGVVSDTTHPFTVAQGGTYQFRLTAAARPSFAAGSASFTVEYAGQEGNDYFYKVHAVGQAGDGCGFYINGEAQPVAVATIA